MDQAVVAVAVERQLPPFLKHPGRGPMNKSKVNTKMSAVHGSRQLQPLRTLTNNPFASLAM